MCQSVQPRASRLQPYVLSAQFQTSCHVFLSACMALRGALHGVPHHEQVGLAPLACPSCACKPHADGGKGGKENDAPPRDGSGGGVKQPLADEASAPADEAAARLTAALRAAEIARMAAEAVESKRAAGAREARGAEAAAAREQAALRAELAATGLVQAELRGKLDRAEAAAEALRAELAAAHVAAAAVEAAAVEAAAVEAPPPSPPTPLPPPSPSPPTPLPPKTPSVAELRAELAAAHSAEAARAEAEAEVARLRAGLEEAAAAELAAARAEADADAAARGAAAEEASASSAAELLVARAEAAAARAAAEEAEEAWTAVARAEAAAAEAAGARAAAEAEVAELRRQMAGDTRLVALQQEVELMRTEHQQELRAKGAAMRALWSQQVEALGEKEAEHAQAAHSTQLAYSPTHLLTYSLTHIPTYSPADSLTHIPTDLPTQLISTLRKEHEAVLFRDARARARSSFEPAELGAAGAAPSVPRS